VRRSLPIFLLPLLPVALASPAAAQDPRTCELAADYSEERDGVALLVLRDGQTVFERYARSTGSDVPRPIGSGARTLWALAAMAAVEDGWLDIEEPASETLSEWSYDYFKGRILVRHLLDNTAGLDPAQAALRGARSDDAYSFAVAQVDAIDDPGSTFRYGPSNYQALGELLRRKLAARGDTPLAFLRRRLLDPLGIEAVTWRLDGEGNVDLSGGVSMTARDWAKIGLLVLNRGRWEGQQVLDPALLERCLEGSHANPGYGFSFWLNPSMGALGPRGELRIPFDALPDLVLSAGGGGQRLYVSRERNLVVVRQAERPRGRSVESDYSDASFLSLLILGQATDRPYSGR
jgi:CubicO group peptidase (beta-lactamase class C family)